MKKNEKSVKLNRISERLAKEYCLRQNMAVEEFIDEAIMEKLELEELRAEAGDMERIDGTAYSYAENYIINDIEEDEYKKKH